MKKPHRFSDLLTFRISRGLTLRDLSRLTGLSPATIHRLERGVLQASPRTLARLQKGLRISKVQVSRLLKTRIAGRIECDPDILSGKPIIRSTRIAVQFVFDLLAAGWDIQEILENYPKLSKEDIEACMRYGSSVIEEEKVFPVGPR